jgi:hypothetical protein
MRAHEWMSRTSSLRTLLTVALIASSACDPHVAAEDPETADPDVLEQQAASASSSVPSFAEVQANGTGCPAGTWQTRISSDGLVFTTTFSAYEAEVDPSTMVAVKDCQLSIKLHTPPGRSISVQSFSYTGYATLTPGVRGKLLANYYFQGEPVEPSSPHTDLIGPYDKTFLFRDDVPIRDAVWSPCGLDRELNIATRIMLQNSTPASSAYMNLTALDGSSRLVVALASRGCSATAQPPGSSPPQPNGPTGSGGQAPADGTPQTAAPQPPRPAHSSGPTWSGGPPQPGRPSSSGPSQPTGTPQPSGPSMPTGIPLPGDAPRATGPSQPVGQPSPSGPAPAPAEMPPRPGMPALNAAGPSAPFRINVGGGAVPPFGRDQGSTDGTLDTTTALVNTTGVTNAAPAAVYQNQRIGTFGYRIGGLTPQARYTLRLHFAEIYWNVPNRRVFNIAVNGAAVETNLDIFARSGSHKALVRDYPAQADALGQIVVSFTTVKDNAALSGLEILLANASATAPAPATGLPRGLNPRR